MSISRADLLQAFDGLLQPERFKDYGPNGLQVEGKEQIARVVSGVTASKALIEAAIAARADAIFVHHGLFWRGHDGCLTGWLKARVARLLAAEVNLFAYHLPLDAHAELGNNAQLGLRLGLKADARFGDQDLGFIGDAAPGDRAESLAQRTRAALGRDVLLLPGDGRVLRRVAWCTGGAQGYFEPAMAAGADLFLTGEISEPQAHLARETGVAFMACGHHATERYGAPAVAAHVAAQFGVPPRHHAGQDRHARGLRHPPDQRGRAEPVAQPLYLAAHRQPQPRIEVSALYHDLQFQRLPPYQQQGNADIDLRFATLMDDLGLPRREAHDALNDAVMAALAFVKLRQLHGAG